MSYRYLKFTIALIWLSWSAPSLAAIVIRSTAISDGELRVGGKQNITVIIESDVTQQVTVGLQIFAPNYSEFAKQFTAVTLTAGEPITSSFSVPIVSSSLVGKYLVESSAHDTSTWVLLADDKTQIFNVVASAPPPSTPTPVITPIPTPSQTPISKPTPAFTPTPLPSPTPSAALPTPSLPGISTDFILKFDEEYSGGLSKWIDHEPWQLEPGYAQDGGYNPIPANSLAQVTNGILSLQNAACINPIKAPMCGVELSTQNSYYTFKHGYLESRVKIPNNAQGWPALWLLGNGTGDESWPKTGEIDIFEFVNNTSSMAVPFFTVHWYCSSNSGGHCQKTYQWPSPVANFSSQYHTWALLRTSDTLKVYIDNVLWSKFTAAELQAVGASSSDNRFQTIFNGPMHIRTDISTGGNNVSQWPYDPLHPAEPGSFLIDYVRVWEAP